MADARRPREKKIAADAAAEPRRSLSADELRREAEERLAGLAEVAAARVPEELTAAVHELHASEERHRALFEDNRAVMLLIDPRTGAIVDANPAACAWYGWSRAELLAMRIDQINTLSAAEVRAEMGAARAKEQGVFNFRHRLADGTTHYVEVFSVPIDVHGRTLLYSLIHDVTARELAQQELLQSEEKYRTILQTAMDGFWLVDTGGRLLEVNEASCRMSGYSAEELLAMAVGDLASAETAARIERITAQGEDRFESRHRRKDGTVFDVEVSVQHLPGGSGRLMVVLRDISERKQAESYREMAREVLQILNGPADLHDSIRAVLALVKAKTGLDAVGIRLLDGDDFPYYTQEGFSAGFLRTESSLHERGADGEVRRDAGGHVKLECACGLVISGKTDASSPLCTPGGSFWTNDSFPLLDLPPDQDPRLNPRNRCMHHGYASMALVPIRSGDGIVGLIHLDDRRKGCFTLKTIELLEDIAAHLGAALVRKQAEDALRESEALYRSILSASPDDIATTDLEGRRRTISPGGVRMVGLAGEGAGPGRTLGAFVVAESLLPEDRERAQADLVLLLHGAYRGPNREEYRGLRADGSSFAVEVNADLILDSDDQPTGAVFITRDITERKEAEQKSRLFAQAQTELRERKQAEKALVRSARELHEQLLDTMKTMGAIVGLRDPYTAAHERRVTELAVAIALEMGLGEEALEGLAFAGEVHDIGKVAVPAEILSKPAALNEEEYALIRRHPQAGRELLSAIRFRQPVAEIVGQHQERLDGSGYPDGLKGEEIMLEARILAVADVVEAMASHRPYRPSLGLEAALAEVRASAGVRYDAEVVAACERVFAAGFVFGES
jgi:PAS domain S-box-containing protein